MNKSTKSISLIIAAGLAGVAAFQIANSALSARVPGDVLIAIGASAAVLGLAAFDYSRRINPLRLPGRLLRPTLPERAACTVNAGAKSDRNDRLAA